MADQVLKTVRITDNIKVEVLQQGKKRKYALFYDGDTEFITSRGRGYEETDKNNNTKSEKYDVAMSDDDVIEMALKAYNSRFGSPQKKWYITQKVYSDPAPARTYGNGEKSPYYISNGCAINIQWIGKIPNPEFNPGTYSNLNQADNASEKDGKPRYLENANITSTTDNSENSDNLPKSSWSVSPPITDGISGINQEEVPTDYRDRSYVHSKIVTVTLPKGFTENGGKGYLVWTDDGLQYDSKSIPENTPTKMVYVDGRYIDVGYRKPKNQIRYFEGYRTDAYVIEQVINDFDSKVYSLHGIFRYDLKLCAPDNETCSLIPYKSPLESPNNTPEQAAINDIPPPVPIQSGKLKLSIQGLFDTGDGTTPGSTASVFEIKAKTNMPAFIVWSGEIPKTEEIDQFENLPELDEEYSETGFGSAEEQEWKPIITEIDGDFDPDTSKGEVEAGNFDNTPAPQSFVPATQTQKDFIKAAVTATLSRGGAHGRCGRFTFNMAKNYVRLLQGKSVQQGAGNAAGGNAKDSGYHQNLISMGYKIVSTESISKSNLINKIKTNGWAVGDVIVYWCTDGPRGASYVRYGHTQIFTNGYHNDSRYRWSTDEVNNYPRGGGEFVYASKEGNSWKLIHLQAPKTKRVA
jgi:hypothetical protein